MAFRREHLIGQQSISQGVRDSIGYRFKGSDEDGLVLIFQSKSPYKEGTSPIYGVFDTTKGTSERSCMFWDYSFESKHMRLEVREDFQSLQLSK